jgi:hypothetical protein
MCYVSIHATRIIYQQAIPTACEMQLRDSDMPSSAHAHIKKYESELEISRSVGSIRKMCSLIDATLLWPHISSIISPTPTNTT